MDLEQLPLQRVQCLSSFQVSSLQKGTLRPGHPQDNQELTTSTGGIRLVADLLLAAPRDLAKVLKLPIAEVHAILKSISKELVGTHVRWKNLDDFRHETFSTGDDRIDALLGGGIRTGMVWELAGERFVARVIRPSV